MNFCSSFAVMEIGLLRVLRVRRRVVVAIGGVGVGGKYDETTNSSKKRRMHRYHTTDETDDACSTFLPLACLVPVVHPSQDIHHKRILSLYTS